MLFLKKARLGTCFLSFNASGALGWTKVHGDFYAGDFLAQGNGDTTNFVIPVWMMILCSLVMALGINWWDENY